MADEIKYILMWPIEEFRMQPPDYAALAVGAGVMYYMLGGLPFQGEELSQTAQAYLAGGLASYGYMKFVQKQAPGGGKY